jgi:predicted pyridoxine 5'-phosphate oxidase superfamily flavin-nucleotide-binding protein
MSRDEHGVMTHDNLTAHALAMLDANRYLVLGTIDPDGRPWTSPVYFAADGRRKGIEDG